MRILISGATGLVGSALVESLHSKGHNIRCLQRNKKPGSTSIWQTDDLFAAPESDEPFDVVIHLAGENVADGRWSNSKKRRIMNSRIDGTRELVEYLATLPKPPSTFICASAIGYYGDRGDEILTEESGQGAGFLKDVCKNWEIEARKASQSGSRVVILRFGMVLSPKGGALSKMLPPFKAGIGGPIGKGEQYMSWVTIRDLTEIVNFAINTDSLEGPVNVVSPTPIVNKEFTKTLAEVLKKPARLPAPPFGLRLLFGEMADEMLLSSSRVKPEKLLKAGYVFRDRDLKASLEYCIKS